MVLLAGRADWLVPVASAATVVSVRQIPNNGVYRSECGADDVAAEQVRIYESQAHAAVGIVFCSLRTRRPGGLCRVAAKRAQS